jgi:hypothetical protein
MSILKTSLTSFGLMTAVAFTPAGAYNENTHRDLSVRAFDLSGIAQALATYGISPTDRFRQRILAFPFQQNTPREWVRIGGSEEDVPFTRVLNHFYDPAHDEPIGILGGVRAPEWALEDHGDLNSQNHSYRDARNALYAGITLPSRTARERELGHTFFTPSQPLESWARVRGGE